MTRAHRCFAMLAILGLVGLLYWPARHGGFVWDDTSSLHDEAWLRGSDWTSFVFHGFNGWINYFRPLVVLLFAAEIRLFDDAPGPMHLVSISMHLANTLLVGLLAWNLFRRNERSLSTVVAPMLFFGLHPALIEPVDWVGNQFELGLVFGVLLGLLANAAIRSTGQRALSVGLCFLLAAGFKEAAAAFPLLLVLFDLHGAGGSRWRERLRATWLRQRSVYAAVLCAGLIYLAVRYWALGHIVLPSGSEPLMSFSRLQRVCLTYLDYWKLILWPMTSIGPIHPFDPRQFDTVTPQMLAADIAVFAIAAFGAYAFLKRWANGVFVLAVSVALLPVLNIAPVELSESLYHDRYATTAIAIACVLLPELAAALLARARVVRVALPAVALAWLALAAVNIHVTVPLWADEVALWRWSAQQHPASVEIQQHLLATYIQRNDRAHARELADALVTADARCAYCMLNAADLAIADRDAERAALALRKMENAPELARDARFARNYVLASGALLELRADWGGAEQAYREAMHMDASDPLPQMALAMLLAKQGRIDAARAQAAIALPLFAPDLREPWHRKFETALTQPEARP